MEYLPIRLKTIHPDEKVAFDIFIKLGQRYVHYISNQDLFDSKRVQNLKDKGVKKLFINVSSEDAYLDYLDQGLRDLADENIAVEDKGKVANNTLINAAENAERMVESKVKFTKTGENINKIVDFLANESGALKSMMDSGDIDADNAQHCATVTSLSLGLAMKMGIQDKEQLVNLGLSALLHDVGLKQLQDIDIDMDPEKLEAEALKKYKEHPRLGMELLSNKPFINETILELIYNHEEKGQGEGFPEKKTLKQLPVLCQILNLCNDYDRYCRMSQVAHTEASSKFFQEKLGLFELEYLNKLKELIKEAK